MENKEAREILSQIKHNNPMVNDALHLGVANIDRWGYLKTTIENWGKPDPSVSEDYRMALNHIKALMTEIEQTYK